MKLSLHIFFLVLLAGPVWAQTNGAVAPSGVVNQGGAGNQYGGSNQITGKIPSAQGTNSRSNLPPAPVNAAAFSDATVAGEKPAVKITAQGTVLTDEQKQLISKRLQDIPGVVVITNRIRVLGEINEAAGASRTNRGAVKRLPGHRNTF